MHVFAKFMSAVWKQAAALMTIAGERVDPRLQEDAAAGHEAHRQYGQPFQADPLT